LLVAKGNLKEMKNYRSFLGEQERKTSTGGGKSERLAKGKTKKQERGE